MSYPAVTVKNVIRYLRPVFLLKTETMTEGQAFNALGIETRSATYSYNKSSAEQYGLIKNAKNRKSFIFTNVGKKMFSSDDVDENQLRELLQKPDLYKRLRKKFSEFSTMEYKEVREEIQKFGVIPKRAEIATDVFFKNLKDANVLGDNRIKKLVSNQVKLSLNDKEQTDDKNNKIEKKVPQVNISVNEDDVIFNISRNNSELINQLMSVIQESLSTKKG